MTVWQEDSEHSSVVPVVDSVVVDVSVPATDSGLAICPASVARPW